MAEESSTTSHLSVVVTSNGIDETPTTGASGMMRNFFTVDRIYWRSAVIFIGVVGIVGNALILYALLASKQHKKLALIVNQNALDLFSSIFVVITYAMQLANIHHSGLGGYWLCFTITSENLIWWGTNGSMVNLAIVTIDRYLKVVHAARSGKWLRPWVIYSAMAFSWFVGILYNTAIVAVSTKLRRGYCTSYVHATDLANMASFVFYLLFFYILIIVIFVFFYWRILVKIRRQAQVMASHGSVSSSAQAQSHQIQTNVIKTMILVSALYAIAWLPYNIYALAATTGIIPLSFGDSGYYATSFVAFIYTSANPFIYATKFNPVKEVLKKMIPCKKTPVQPAG